MTINLKYYIITIAAIFLAIGIGISIGIMLDGQGFIVDQQKQLVNQLENKFNEFKTKQDSLQERIDLLTQEKEKNAKFMDTFYPEIIKNKLNHLNVVIIETNTDYAYSGLTDAFVKAGASNVASILIQDPFLLEDENIAAQVCKDLNLTGNKKEEIEKQLIRSFCNAVINGKNSEVINYLKDKKMIDYVGDFMPPVNYVVIAGGSTNSKRSTLNRIDIPIIHYIKNNNIPVVAVEQLGVAYSNIPDYKKLRISTVDDVDTIIGKVSMLMVASGKEGHFGEKETADELMPDGFMPID